MDLLLGFRLSSQEREMRQMKEDYDQEIRSLKSKHEAALDFLKQESHLSGAKVGLWVNAI